jgi:hypothetical protein
MLKKITSVRDIQKIERGDNLFDCPDPLLATKYMVSRRIVDDLIVEPTDGTIETKLLTRNDLISGNWWVKPK